MNTPATDSSIILTTLNARYIHSSLGLRYLLANMGELEDQTQLVEYNINGRAIDIAEQLLKSAPAIIGFGLYIWNIEQITRVIKLIKTIRPQTIIIIGGPEVSYEFENVEAFEYSDYLITGQADVEFFQLCQKILNGEKPGNKIIHASRPDINKLKLPYKHYTQTDIDNRIIYVEASRGCPFKCEFCLSALDKTAYPFDLDRFLEEMDTLYKRGVRHFKFVDRTFNLKPESSKTILDFFLQRMDKDLFLHFELIPDNLPEALKEILVKFPENSLQFEIGIQSLNPDVQQLISRKQNNEKSHDNITWISRNTHAHIHADLIIGLPGESMQAFSNSLNKLAVINPDEIQIGILKRLKGTPIIRHTSEFDMRFNPEPPYNILSNKLIDFNDMQRLSRFSRYWDMIINSGRFNHSKPLILLTQPFDNFMALSDWLYAETGQTHKFELQRLFKLLYRALIDILDCDLKEAETALTADFVQSGLKGRANFSEKTQQQEKKASGKTRQLRH
ncbi:MAG: B12-binding domain-containing radical SAM protein [Gammaproteobacteria bacterium]|nr:B12-binding domain-containing radical SAM protein [Gammaproteobacteria bacterium]